ncbi:MAG: SGNH/GDSL hydrolase family protein [Anaerobutyricum hallii]|uniref:SGNH/GDSL hydrolase family protein n=1 Tax=Anaerobutyricum hallii TaxID=39488 RepID=UPI002E77CBB9|nr:SGNH/GDSL hydrolase family protein [Anaerobutyricum hallii]MEE1485316.1 SGNH/GDSL hydrolase family protein [Anaerobutyricum hallii]
MDKTIDRWTDPDGNGYAFKDTVARAQNRATIDKMNTETADRKSELDIERKRIDNLIKELPATAGEYQQSKLVLHSYDNTAVKCTTTSGNYTNVPAFTTDQGGPLSSLYTKKSNYQIAVNKSGLYLFELRIHVNSLIANKRVELAPFVNDTRNAALASSYNTAGNFTLTQVAALPLWLSANDTVDFRIAPIEAAEVSLQLGDVLVYAIDWEDKFKIPDYTGYAAETKDIRTGADGTVYGTAGEAVRKQIGNLTEDLVSSTKDAWTWSGDFSKATEMFKPTDIVGNNYPFKSGYVDSVELSVFAVSGNDATLFVTDTNRKILFKTTKIIKDNDLVIPVNKSFDVDFYVFVSYSGLKFYNSTNVYSDKWAGLSFDNYGSYLVGDVLPIFNNNGRVGFAFKVKYATTNGKIMENTYNIDKYRSVDIKIVSETDNAHFSIDEKGTLYSRKIGTTSGCYPCFFDAEECITFEMTNDETWIIVSTNDTGKFVSLGFKGDGIVFASFNVDGSLISVDYTRSYLVKTWLNSKITFVWNDEYFCSIYRNEHLIYKFDIRHTSTDIITHNFGVGVYSNMQDGARVRIIDSVNKNKIFLDDVCVLGDSFTDNARDSLGAGTFYFTRWYEYARELNHIKTVYNYGFGGTCMSPSVSGENSFYNRMQTMYSEHNNPSAVFVLGGTNDYHNDVPLGTINDVTTDTFYGTLNRMCEYFKENFHTSKVVFCTPIMRVSPSNGKTETIPANNQTNSNGNSLEQFANAIIEVCHKWALPCFDAYHNSGICPQARNTQNFAWFMNDGIHMKQNGHKQLGMRFGEFAKPFM